MSVLHPDAIVTIYRPAERRVQGDARLKFMVRVMACIEERACILAGREAPVLQHRCIIQLKK